MLETKYGWVDPKDYYPRLTKEEVAEMISDIQSIPSFDVQADVPLLPFFQKWNREKFYLKFPDNCAAVFSNCELLNEAIKTNHIELICFIYERLLVDDRIYSLERADFSSIRRKEIVDLLIEYTGQFSSFYQRSTTDARERLQSLRL